MRSSHVMSAVDLTHEMGEVDKHLAWSTGMRTDMQQWEIETKEEMARFDLRINNLEIAL
jgi:hypothetical protein